MVLEAKYGIGRDGWDIKDANYYFVVLWRNIILVKEASAKTKIRYHVHTRKRIMFWHDLWVGDSPLAAQFPDLSGVLQIDKLK